MIVVEDKDELLRLIERRIKKRGNNCDLNDIDVSRWDLSSVEDIESISEDSPSLGYMWSNMMRGIE